MVGLNVHDVTVDGRRARLRRTDHELIITPRRKLRKHHRFVAVRYSGVPRTLTIPGFGIGSGFMATDDGAVVAGQPEVAAFWHPVNDHPIDRATYTFRVTVPDGVGVASIPAVDESLANQGEILGFLEDHLTPYPFETVGAIVDDYENLFFALENQTRPRTPASSSSSSVASRVATPRSCTNLPTVVR
jgi:aminopeptidase N